MSEIKPGKYQARLANYWIGKTSAGLPQAELLFEFEIDGEPRELIWFGSFKEKARPYTLKALLYCGMKGDDPTSIADGPEGGALELGKEVLITIARETDDKGNPRLRINWINPLGGAHFRERVNRGDLRNQLASLKGEMAAVRKETGINDDPENFENFGTKKTGTDDVGF
jgi:hypothetical protein